MKCRKTWVLGLRELLVRNMAVDKLLHLLQTHFLFVEMEILDPAFCPYWFYDSGDGNILDMENCILKIMV